MAGWQWFVAILTGEVLTFIAACAHESTRRAERRAVAAVQLAKATKRPVTLTELLGAKPAAELAEEAARG